MDMCCREAPQASFACEQQCHQASLENLAAAGARLSDPGTMCTGGTG